MRKILFTIVFLLLILVAYLLLWPVPINPVSWNAPMPPGYVGPHAVNTKLSNLKIIPLGKEEGLEHIAIGKDGKIYSCTYPNAKLVSYDPATGKSEDLGRMHPTEMYARSVAAGADGWIYIAIGPQIGGIVAYDPKSREHHSVLPESLRGQPQPDTGAVSLGTDGHVYGFFRNKTLRLENGKATLEGRTGRSESPAVQVGTASLVLLSGDVADPC